MYFITGNLTFSTQANRNSAHTAMLGVALLTAVATASKYPGGINTSGTTGITVSLAMNGSDAEARTVTRALFNASTPYSRTAGHIAVAKVPD